MSDADDSLLHRQVEGNAHTKAAFRIATLMTRGGAPVPVGVSQASISPPRARRARLVAAFGIGTAAAIVSGLHVANTFHRFQVGDFTPIYVGAQAMLKGADPYAAVAARTDLWLHLLFYPYPALVIIAPLLTLPMQLAATAFIAFGSAWLAYVVTREAWWPLWIFAGAGFFQSVLSVQWTPLLIAAALAGPSAGLALAVKPTYALPLLAMQSRIRAILLAAGVGIGLVLVSLLIAPHWPSWYARTVRESPIRGEYISPAFTWLGLPLWLALLRWRSWQSRLLLGMAITPLNAWTYSHLPLLLVARTRQQLALLALASWVAYFATNRITFQIVSNTPIVAVTSHVEWIAIVGYYLPALLVVLVGPNPGAVSVER